MSAVKYTAYMNRRFNVTLHALSSCMHVFPFQRKLRPPVQFSTLLNCLSKVGESLVIHACLFTDNNTQFVL